MDVHGAFSPLDATARVGALQRVMRPTQKRHGGPEESVQDANQNHAQVSLKAYGSQIQRLIDDVVAFNRDRRHQINARAAYEVHREGARDAARSRKYPPVK